MIPTRVSVEERKGESVRRTIYTHPRERSKSNGLGLFNQAGFTPAVRDLDTNAEFALDLNYKVFLYLLTMAYVPMMNTVLKEILETKQVSDEQGKTFPLDSAMDTREGALLTRVFEHVRPTTSLEVGMAYGVSTLFICDALNQANRPARHIAIDPFQYVQWKGIGCNNVKRAGYEKFVEWREEMSEIALPALVAEKTVLDAALIDGFHTFDHTLVDFFYINKMLRVGGIVVIDDACFASVGKVIDHILTYGCYRIFATPEPSVPILNSRSFLFAKRFAYYAGIKGSKWPSAIALEKIALDERSWNWHRSF